MQDNEFKDAITTRRTDLKMSYRDIQGRTKLGYNTVRRVFADPFTCRISSVLAVLRSMSCDLHFTIENHIGDELEPESPVEPLTKEQADGEASGPMAG